MHGQKSMGFYAMMPTKSTSPLRFLLTALVVSLLLQPCLGPADGTDLGHEHPPSGQDGGADTGMEEHLGGK
jgi:hypothetical protein